MRLAYALLTEETVEILVSDWVNIRMNKNLLVKLFGHLATLIHGDTLVLDRWFWLKRRLPRTNNGETLIDIGCGTGAFTFGAARRGYDCLGLSWDERNQAVANERAGLCGVKEKAKFEICDIRQLDSFIQKSGNLYDAAICTEAIEHILDDRKLMCDIADCLKPGGRLLLTTPNYLFIAMTEMDMGPFPTVETGPHVRRGYTKTMLEELCRQAGLIPDEISYCSGFFSQKVTRMKRGISNFSPLFAWAVILPLRPFIPLLDATVAKLLNYPGYSICLVAQKPRFETRP